MYEIWGGGGMSDVFKSLRTKIHGYNGKMVQILPLLVAPTLSLSLYCFVPPGFEQLWKIIKSREIRHILCFKGILSCSVYKREREKLEMVVGPHNLIIW